MKKFVASLFALCALAFFAVSPANAGHCGFGSGFHGYHSAGVSFLAAPYVPTVAVAVQPIAAVPVAVGVAAPAVYPPVAVQSADPVAVPAAIQPVAAVPVAVGVVTPTYAAPLIAAVPGYAAIGHARGFGSGHFHGRFNAGTRFGNHAANKTVAVRVNGRRRGVFRVANTGRANVNVRVRVK